MATVTARAAVAAVPVKAAEVLVAALIAVAAVAAEKVATPAAESMMSENATPTTTLRVTPSEMTVVCDHLYSHIDLRACIWTNSQ